MALKQIPFKGHITKSMTMRMAVPNMEEDSRSDQCPGSSNSRQTPPETLLHLHDGTTNKLAAGMLREHFHTICDMLHKKNDERVLI